MAVIPMIGIDSFIFINYKNLTLNQITYSILRNFLSSHSCQSF